MWFLLVVYQNLIYAFRSFICFFFKQKTAYDMRISDWSSDVCSSDLQNSVRFLSADEIAEARRFTVLQTYLDERGREIEHWNTGRDAPNRRQMTNIGVFRAYVAAYLAAHPGINHEMTQMVRQQIGRAHV